MNKDFAKAAAIRAIKTMCQVFLSMVTLGQGLFDVNWMMILSTMVMSGIYSVVTSIATGLPEVKYDGEIIFEPNEDGVTQVRLNLDDFKDGMNVKLVNKINSSHDNQSVK